MKILSFLILICAPLFVSCNNTTTCNSDYDCENTTSPYCSYNKKCIDCNCFNLTSSTFHICHNQSCSFCKKNTDCVDQYGIFFSCSKGNCVDLEGEMNQGLYISLAIIGFSVVSMFGLCIVFGDIRAKRSNLRKEFANLD